MRDTPTPKAVTALLAFLLEGNRHPLAAPLATWLVASPRFRAFAEANQGKIRKKIRGLRDVEGGRDLQLELEVAYLLLQERRFDLTYEPTGTGKTRGPDFAVTFRTRAAFNVEVTRQRPASPEQLALPSTPASTSALPRPTSDREEARLTETLCSKLRQLLPGMSNLVLIGAEEVTSDEVDLNRAMARLKGRAERREATLFTRHGFQDTADFFKHYQRLSGLLVRGTQPLLWLNNQAKHPLPPELRVALQKLPL